MSLEKRQQRKANRLARSIRKSDEAAGIAEQMEARNEEPKPDVIFDDVEQEKDKKKKSSPDFVTPEYSSLFGKPSKYEAPEEVAGKSLVNALNTASSNDKNISGAALYSVTAEADKNATFGQTQEIADAAVKAGEVRVQTEKENENAINQQIEGISEQLEKVDTQEKTEQEPVIGGTGAAAAKAAGGAAGQRPSYESQATKEEVAKEMNNVAKEYDDLESYVPQAVVEKLGVQDYYPSIGQDIAVGTWTGSVLGSQTIYAGGGALLPMGLYDARARALNEAAKQRQAMIDKIYELPNTADQFNVKYQDYAYDFIEKSLEEYGSFDAMMADPKWKREMARIKNIGKEITYTDKQVDKLLEDLGKNKWVPQGVRNKAFNFKSGIVEDLDSILSGKTSAAKDVQYLRSYENGSVWADGKVKDGMFDENRLSEAPINLKTGGLYESEKWKQERNQFFQTMAASPDKDLFVSGVKKYFDISNIEKEVDNWIKLNNADPSTRDALVDYLAAQIPTKIVLDKQLMDNKNFEREKLASDNAWRQKEFEQRIIEGKTFYTTLNETMDTPAEDGSTLNDNLASVSSNAKTMKRGLKDGRDVKVESKLRKQIKDSFLKSGFAAVFDPYSNTFVRRSAASAQMTSRELPIGSSSLVKIQEYDKDAKKFIQRVVTIDELAKKKSLAAKGNIKAADGSKYTVQEIEDIANSSAANNINLKPQTLETTKGFVKKDGNLVAVTEYNIQDYNPNTNRNISRVVGAAYTKGKPIMEDGKPKMEDGKVVYQSVPLKGEFYTEYDISDPSVRTPLDSQFGGREVKYFKPQGEASTVYSGSSSSGSE